jgi:hypothetical protein
VPTKPLTRSTVKQGLDTIAARYRSRVAITETREVVIAAMPNEIIDVLVDLESLTEWSSAHQSESRGGDTPGPRTGRRPAETHATAIC